MNKRQRKKSFEGTAKERRRWHRRARREERRAGESWELSPYEECDGYEPPDYDDDEFDQNDLDLDDCGLLPDGACTKAGSEECDWKCSYGPIRRMRLAGGPPVGEGR